MLCLDVKLEEVVEIGQGCAVMVIGFKNNRTVRLGFTAPRHLPINRRKVADAMRSEGKSPEHCAQERIEVRPALETELQKDLAAFDDGAYTPGQLIALIRRRLSN